MALRTNKQMDVSHLKRDVAKNIRKSMRTKYLPHISAIGTYQFTSREISLLNDEQKAALPNIGTTIGSMAKGGMADMAGSLTKMGSVLSLLNIPPQMLEPMQQEMATMQQNLAQGVNNATGMLNAGGQRIVDALHTDTRNLWAGSIMAVQPVFMGGSIIAMNKMADLGEQMASHSEEARRQSIIYSVDKIYWQVVSLKHKKRLAESFLAVV
jgi:outer membrane protein TolC